MSHPFGNLLSQHLHRKHGLSQAKLAEGILQDPSVIAKMCKGKRLNGPQARARVCAVIEWLHQQAVLMTLDEANQLLVAAGMAPLNGHQPAEQTLSQKLESQPKSSPTSAQTARRLTNLPTPLTSFVGRIPEVTEVAQLLATHRLVTLTGAGGVGKTRLALEIGKALLDVRAQERVSSGRERLKFPDGVWFIELAAFTEGELSATLVAQAIARLFNRPEQPERTPLEVVEEYLADKQLLLVLDNCEQLVDSCAEIVVYLLSHCWGLYILATSRAELSIPGEMLYPVLPLALPVAGTKELAGMLDCASAQLFIERMRTALPFAVLQPGDGLHIAQICRQLDGIPLALELAAPLVRRMTLAEIASQLHNQMTMLISSYRMVASRHQTMQNALTWSYRLLAPVEQQVLARLSVFVGGWTVAASEAVCGVRSNADLAFILQQLVSTSWLLTEKPNGLRRYRCLEPVRQFVYVQLVASDEQEEIHHRHTAYFLALAEQIATEIPGPQQATWLACLELEYNNLLSALEWSLATGLWETAMRLAAALSGFWMTRGRFSEGRAWLERVLEHGTTAPPALRAQVLNAAGHLASEQNDFVRAQELIEESLALCQKLSVSHQQGEVLTNLGLLELFQGRFARAAHQFEAALACYQLFADVSGIAASIQNLGLVALYSGDNAQAATSFTESLRLFRQLGETGAIADALCCMGQLAVNQGDPLRATVLLRESLALLRTLGDTENISDCLKILALSAMSQGSLTRAVRLLAAAVGVREAIGAPMPPIDAVRYEHAVATVRTQLDEVAFTAAWEAGRAMPLEQAVAYALGE
ncbi:MAG: tetratricopeptide repeat protein [Caldilineaceae bacterium]